MIDTLKKSMAQLSPVIKISLYLSNMFCLQGMSYWDKKKNHVYSIYIYIYTSNLSHNHCFLVYTCT